MHQIVLSDSASQELAQIDKLEQLGIVSEFSRIRKEPVQNWKDLGIIQKGDRTLYRHRYQDYRIYFEKKEDQIVIHRVLHGNSIRDFFVRSNLDFESDEEFEKSAKFWKFIEPQKIKVRTG